MTGIKNCIFPKERLAKNFAYLGMLCSVSLKNWTSGGENKKWKPKKYLQQMNRTLKTHT